MPKVIKKFQHTSNCVLKDTFAEDLLSTQLKKCDGASSGSRNFTSLNTLPAKHWKIAEGRKKTTSTEKEQAGLL